MTEEKIDVLFSFGLVRTEALALFDEVTLLGGAKMRLEPRGRHVRTD